MKEAHKHMKIDEQAFHAVAYHVMRNMEAHNAGRRAEREEVLGILYSLKKDVQAGQENPAAENPMSFDNFFKVVSRPHREKGILDW